MRRHRSRLHQRRHRRTGDEVRLEMRRLLSIGHGTASRLPRLQAAVEHRDGVVAHPLQHPPQTAAVVGAVSVVHDGLHVVPQADAGQPRRELFAARQRVAPARRRFPFSVCDQHGAVAARSAVWCAQIAIEVGVDSAGNVRGVVLSGARLGLHQRERAVENHHCRARFLHRLRLLEGDQGAVHKSPSLFFAVFRCLQCSSAGAFGSDRWRSTVAAMPLATISAMPAQPAASMRSPNTSTL